MTFNHTRTQNPCNGVSYVSVLGSLKKQAKPPSAPKRRIPTVLNGPDLWLHCPPWAFLTRLMKHITVPLGEHSQRRMNLHDKKTEQWLPKKKKKEPYLLTHNLYRCNKFERLPLENHKPMSEILVWTWTGKRGSEARRENHTEGDKHLISKITNRRRHQQKCGWVKRKRKRFATHLILYHNNWLSHCSDYQSDRMGKKITAEWREHTLKYQSQ